MTQGCCRRDAISGAVSLRHDDGDPDDPDVDGW